jgi:hypothetical protein
MSLVSVYAVTNLGSFRTKVGISANPRARLGNMQTGSPEKLYLVYQSRPINRTKAQEVERIVHLHLAQWRLHGEWFDVPYDMCVEPIELAIERGYVQ